MARPVSGTANPPGPVRPYLGSGGSAPKIALGILNVFWARRCWAARGQRSLARLMWFGVCSGKVPP